MADEEFKIEFVNPVNDVGRGTFHNIEIAHHRAENAALRAQGSALEHDLDRARGHAQEYLNELEPLRSRVKELEGERDAYRARKDAAYEERNNVVACLARLFPSGIARTNIPGWDEEWHGCVYINLPSGQISYHYHDSQAYLFEGLPPYNGAWDGHDKDAVHARLQSTGAAAESDARRLRESLEPFAVIGRAIAKSAKSRQWLETPLFRCGSDDDPNNMTLTGRAFDNAAKALHTPEGSAGK